MDIAPITYSNRAICMDGTTFLSIAVLRIGAKKSGAADPLPVIMAPVFPQNDE